MGRAGTSGAMCLQARVAVVCAGAVASGVILKVQDRLRGVTSFLWIRCGFFFPPRPGSRPANCLTLLRGGKDAHAMLMSSSVAGWEWRTRVQGSRPFKVLCSDPSVWCGK